MGLGHDCDHIDFHQSERILFAQKICLVYPYPQPAVQSSETSTQAIARNTSRSDHGVLLDVALALDKVVWL